MLVFFVTPVLSLADGDPIDAEGVARFDTERRVLEDERLPPVLPGEEVGPKEQRMKVWSSSGAVPSAMLEEAKRGPDPSQQVPPVIIDQRSRR